MKMLLKSEDGVEDRFVSKSSIAIEAKFREWLTQVEIKDWTIVVLGDSEKLEDSEEAGTPIPEESDETCVYCGTQDSDLEDIGPGIEGMRCVNDQRCRYRIDRACQDL